MKCKHYKGEGTTYTIMDGTEINLCLACEMRLRWEILEQIMAETEAEPLKQKIIEELDEKATKYDNMQRLQHKTENTERR